MNWITVASLAGIVLVLILVTIVATSRYKKAGPEEALIASGRGGQKIVKGGGMFVMPVIYKLSTLSLQANKIELHRDNIYTKNRIQIVIDAVVIWKVRGTIEAIKLAAENFIGLDDTKRREIIEGAAEGAFRDICGKMTPEEINENREKFQEEVIKNAQDRFEKQGVELITFSVTQIDDKANYFKNLGVPAAAEVDKEARIKKAEAEKSAVVVEAEQNLAGKKRQAETEAEIAEAQKNMNVKKATYNAEVAIENAKADQAGPKATAEATKEVVIEQTKVAEETAKRKEKELLSEKVKPAEAEKAANIAKAEGEKASAALKGEGEGIAALKKGEGEAGAIKAKLFAEADGLERKAEAIKKFNEAGMGLQVAMELIDKLPDIIRAAASPITAVDKLQIIDFGGNGTGGGNGAGGPLARLLDVPPQAIAKADTAMQATLGIGLKDMIQLIRKGGVFSGNVEGEAGKKEPTAEEPGK